MKTLVDTGPLVAYFDKRESSHSWVARQMDELKPPLFTCEAVLTETSFLLAKRIPDGILRLESWLERGLLAIDFDLAEHWRPTFHLMSQYADLPMSLADACLVTMVEQGIGERIFTLDRHFRIYRQKSRRVVPVLIPEA